MADFLLDRALHQQPVGIHRLALADAVRAVDGLVFHGGIPPRIEEHDVARGGEIQAEAAGAQRDEEDGAALRGLEVLHQRPAILGRTGEEKVTPVALHDLRLDEGEHFHELREDEDLVAFLHERLDHVHQRVEFRAFRLLALRSDERGMAADLPQAQQRGQDVEARFIELRIGLDVQQREARALEFGAVERGLFAVEFAEEILLDALGEVLGDLAFRAAQDEGPHPRGEPAAGEGIAALVEVLREVSAPPEHAGHGEGHDAPEIEQAVLDRCAAECQAVRGLQGAGGARGLGLGVLDVLRLVEDDGVPGHRGHFLLQIAELGVVRDHEIGLGARGLESGGIARAALQRAHAQAGGEVRALGEPVVRDALRADDERGMRRVFPAQPKQPREGLHGFAQAHVVGEDAAEVIRREVGEEVEAGELVGAQLGEQFRRHGRRDARLDLDGAALDVGGALGAEHTARGALARELECVEALRRAGEIAGAQAEIGELRLILGAQLEGDAPPAFLPEPHEAAAGVEQQLQLGLGEGGVGHIEGDLEVEPVDARLLRLQLHRRAHRRVAQRGEHGIEQDRKAGWQCGEPLGELLGELFPHRLVPVVFVRPPLELQRGEQLRHGRERAAVVPQDGAGGGLGLRLSGLPAGVAVGLRDHARRCLGERLDVEVLDAVPLVLLQRTAEDRPRAHGAHAGGDARGRLGGDAVEQGDAFRSLQRLGGDGERLRAECQTAERRAGENGACGDIDRGRAIEQGDGWRRRGTIRQNERQPVVHASAFHRLHAPDERLLAARQRLCVGPHDAGECLVAAQEGIEDAGAIRLGVAAEWQAAVAGVKGMPDRERHLVEGRAPRETLACELLIAARGDGLELGLGVLARLKLRAVLGEAHAEFGALRRRGGRDLRRLAQPLAPLLHLLMALPLADERIDFRPIRRGQQRRRALEPVPPQIRGDIEPRLPRRLRCSRPELHRLPCVFQIARRAGDDVDGRLRHEHRGAVVAEKLVHLARGALLALRERPPESRGDLRGESLVRLRRSRNRC